MDNKNLKLFYEINAKDLKLNLICTCEEGKNYDDITIVSLSRDTLVEDEQGVFRALINTL